MKHIFFLPFLLLSILAIAQPVQTLQSPNGLLSFTFKLSGEGGMLYSVSYRQKEIIRESALGLSGWEKGLEIKDISTLYKDSTWQPVYGERRIVTDRFHQMDISLLPNKDAYRILQLQIRAYNEGVAFRYVFPENPEGGKYISIKKENTEFVLPAGTHAWHTYMAQGIYTKRPLKDWPTEAERPLTLELPDNLYVCLAEANMVNYARTRFVLHPEKTNTILTSLYSTVDYYTPFASPWRIVMVAEKPGELLANNDIFLNLNPPCALENTEWIKPGKIMREVTLTMQGAKKLVDFAVKRNLQYIHFDAGWYGYEYVVGSDASAVNVDPRRNPHSDLDLEAVIRYATEKGIGVFLYVNQRALFQQLDTILPLYQKWGVKGIKFGFVQVGSHKWTTWLHEAVQKCAQYNLMVDIHDEYRPTGYSRTYPNLLTQEGIRGNEEMPDATNSTIQPFTRLIAGAADHTICYYHRASLKKALANAANPREMKTTSAHQLALSVIMYSPLQYLYWYDSPEDVQNEPELEFFDNVPTAFDDTRVLGGNIGEYVSIARRKGEEWFVGTVTNTDTRSLKVPLDFLSPGQQYEARIYADDAKVNTRTHVSIKKMKVSAKTVLDVNLVASGGQAIWIKPIPGKSN